MPPVHSYALFSRSNNGPALLIFCAVAVSTKPSPVAYLQTKTFVTAIEQKASA